VSVFKLNVSESIGIAFEIGMERLVPHLRTFARSLIAAAPAGIAAGCMLTGALRIMVDHNNNAEKNG
jgi:hypothetical protein